MSEDTKAGNYFVANYPPFSFWSEGTCAELDGVLAGEPDPKVPLGLYVHLPFCRKRCDFCYFKVYTDKNSGEIRRYLDAVLDELSAWTAHPYLRGRKPSFVYFGGGTPSYLSADQLRTLFEGMRARISWDDVREVAFECEPGTLSHVKIEGLFDLGVTRLSLGVENFDPQILELNNRAHRAKEIYDVYEHARKVGFRQINIDLIAGMVGETEENWSRCIDETVRLRPESVTIYQMEVPFNTTIYQRMKDGAVEVAPVADWDTKRRWVDQAFARLQGAGYHLGSAYTACLDETVEFLYRDALWHGADMLGIGVSSFSQLGGVHFQNETSFEPYLQAVGAAGTAIWRSHPLTDEEKLRREFILQMKLGSVDAGYFRDKFGVDVRTHFEDTLREHAALGYVEVDGDRISSTREGLMRVDSLLHDYFLEEHKNARYA